MHGLICYWIESCAFAWKRMKCRAELKAHRRGLEKIKIRWGILPSERCTVEDITNNDYEESKDWVCNPNPPKYVNHVLLLIEDITLYF